MAIIVGVKRWAIIATAFVGMCAAMGTTVGTWTRRPKIVVAAPPPPPIPDCRDVAQIFGDDGDGLSCDSRATVEVYPMGDRALFKCICRHDGRR